MPNSSNKSAEYTAKSLDEALAAAAREFGVAADKLAYEILQDNTRSILGLVRTGEMRVRVWVREVVEDVQPAAKPAPEVAKPVAAEPAPADDVEDEDDDDDDDQDYDDDEDDDEQDQLDADDPAMERNPPELEDIAMEVVSTLLDKMGVFGAAEIADGGGVLDDQGDVSPMVINIVGDDLGVLIGRRGDTLRDLQFIVRLLISRKLHVWPNLVVDVEDYKERRMESLRSLAERMADQVRETGHPVSLEPMPPNERRIIHLTLRDDPDVYTESVGADDRRKVQILPK